MVRSLYKREIAQSGIDQVQILSPYRTRGAASSDALNETIREEVNPPLQGKPEVMFGGSMFRLDDRVMQMKNNGLIQFRDDTGRNLRRACSTGRSAGYMTSSQAR